MIEDKGWIWVADWNRPVWVELERIDFEKYQVTCIPCDVNGERWVVHPHEFFETELQCAIYQKMMLLREINRIDAYIERQGKSND